VVATAVARNSLLAPQMAYEAVLAVKWQTQPGGTPMTVHFDTVAAEINFVELAHWGLEEFLAASAFGGAEAVTLAAEAS
jgi:hypothetical protein